MNQTVINLETKGEHIFMELKNDITSVSVNIKRKETQNDFPLKHIIFMNIKLKIKAALINLSRITYLGIQKISL